MSRARQRAAARRTDWSRIGAGYVVGLVAAAFLLGRLLVPDAPDRAGTGAAPTPTVTVTVTGPPAALVRATGNADAALAPDGRPDPRFRDCRAARAAGFGNYVAGVNPEYTWYPDTDGDLIVCD